MPKENQNEDIEPAVEEMEEKIKNRDRKKRKRMPISGKNVLKIKELKDKEQKDLPKN